MLEDLLDRARAGKLTSVAYVAEQLDASDSLIGVVGRYREEPTKLLGELSIMGMKLTKYASKKRLPADFQQSVM